MQCFASIILTEMLKYDTLAEMDHLSEHRRQQFSVYIFLRIDIDIFARLL